MTDLLRTQELIAEKCNAIRDMLLEKNAKYGSSATNPLRIFSKSDTVEQIKVRIDDKLSRIKNTGLKAADEDTAKDLIGYLILLQVAEELNLLAKAAESPIRHR